MNRLDYGYEAEASGEGLSLSKGFGQWVDDLIAGGAVILIVSVVGTRAYRWARAQADHPRELVDAMVTQARGARAAAVRGWKGGAVPADRPSPEREDEGLDAQIPVGSSPGV